jgi:hypothetical protein
MSVVCRISAVGRAALAAAEACEFGADGALRSPEVQRSLATEDPEDVRLWVSFGSTLLPYAAPKRPGWDRAMTDWFGCTLGPLLDEVHSAALRLRAGDSLEDILPPPTRAGEDVNA